MTYNKSKILDDLAPFADLGTDAPTLIESRNNISTQFTRDGRQLELTFLADRIVIERSEGEERRHASLRALLASPSFANLGKWADSQHLLLKERVSKENIPINGILLGNTDKGGVELLDSALFSGSKPQSPRTTIVLIDGPAGIGKTSVIRSLAYQRASHYRRTQKPLILHVESRGRMLQNITDLMAFSLQTLRLAVTYDQVPPLVRNGLVTLAIDGFDELGDPNGYDLAWAQVNDLVASSQGMGSIILSGRETFIGKDRIRVALKVIDEKHDCLETYSLCPLEPDTAKTWLKGVGWPVHTFNLENVAPLFEDGSYALRPFFLNELAREGVASQIENGQIEDLLSFLIVAMTEREAGKFGRDVEATTTIVDRKNFIRTLMEEVARDLAENQSDAIPVDSLIWLAEIVANDIAQPGLIGILKNRAGVIAFLTDDDRRGYRRFVHEQVLSYFLSHVTIRSICSGEVPKYIRRNIFGLEFLENFCSVIRRFDTKTVDDFVSAAIENINTLGDQDRSRRNLATLVLATCSVTAPSKTPILKNVSLDEIYLTESVSTVHLRNVTIAQMYVRETDFRSVNFEEGCVVVSMIADGGTIPPQNFPLPSIISLPSKTLVKPTEKLQWVIKQCEILLPLTSYNKSNEILKNFGLFNLLSRVARYKSFWLRDGEEKSSRRILDDPNWERLKSLMIKHDLLIERHDVPASGRPAPFYHVKNRLNLLNLENLPINLTSFFEDVFIESMKIEGMIDE